MNYIEYVNPSSHDIQLTGPDGRVVTIPKHAKVRLPKWFSRYHPKFIREVRKVDGPRSTQLQRKAIAPMTADIKERVKKVRRRAAGVPGDYSVRKAQTAPKKTKKKRKQNQVGSAQQARAARRAKRRRVGRAVGGDSQQMFVAATEKIEIGISNNIGIGILSYNRLNCIQRLLQSIRRYTDLRKVTVFVSDESSDPAVHNWLRQQKDIVYIENSQRLGIAGQSNRLLRCLSRFKYKILLNDDVEVLREGWENFYVERMQRSGLHHFCYRQAGIYGARANDGDSTTINGVQVRTIHSKPHGAVMAFDQIAFNRVGYFDEEFGYYGFEHVDWSNRVGLSGLQPRGYHDAVGSHRFFLIHNERSSTSKEELRSNRSDFESFKDDSRRIYVSPTDESVVPAITVVIPFRITENRAADSISVVVDNIRAQLYPQVDIIISEQDETKKIGQKVQPCLHLHAKNEMKDQPFTKSLAFNLGVAKAQTNKVVLHDADVCVQNTYLAKVDRLLDQYDGLHICSQVFYLSRHATKKVHQTRDIARDSECERVVGYFEGGSLACTKRAYFKVGGFNDVFIGYGCEDCEFFDRLKTLTNFFNERSINLFHLWHGRSPGWEDYHRKNKKLMAKETAKLARNPGIFVKELRNRLRARFPQVMKELGI